MSESFIKNDLGIFPNISLKNSMLLPNEKHQDWNVTYDISHLNKSVFQYDPLSEAFYNDSCSSDLGCNTTGLYRHAFSTRIIICSAYTLVFILGLIGNCFVVAVVFRSPRMRTVTNYYIVNLAVADILVIVFCLPANLLANIYIPWMLGWFMCKSVSYVQTVSVSASVNSLVAVSLDRFLAIWFPLRPQITKTTASGVIILIWIMATGTAIPMAIFFDLVDFMGSKFCLEVWPNKEAEELYFLLAHFILCYLLPLVLISAFYLMIWFKVAHRIIPGDTRDSALRAIQQRSKIKVVKMLVVVVIMFMLSWLPLYVIFVRIKLGGPIDEKEAQAIALITPMAQWLMVFNSCVNPILYAFFNKKYRNGFLAILKSKSCCGSLRGDSFQSTVHHSCYSTRYSVVHTDSLIQSNTQSREAAVYNISGRPSAYRHPYISSNHESHYFYKAPCRQRPTTTSTETKNLPSLEEYRQDENIGTTRQKIIDEIEFIEMDDTLSPNGYSDYSLSSESKI